MAYFTTYIVLNINILVNLRISCQEILKFAKQFVPEPISVFASVAIRSFAFYRKVKAKITRTVKF